MDVVLALARSRKFWAAVLGVVSVIMVNLGFKELVPEQVTAITDAITWIVATWIGSIAVEDAALKRALK